MRLSQAGGYVALTLAVSFGIAFNLFTFAVLYDAVTGNVALSENAAQVLTGWGGGIIGVLGSYIGYRVGATEVSREQNLSSDRDTTISG